MQVFSCEMWKKWLERLIWGKTFCIIDIYIQYTHLFFASFILRHHYISGEKKHDWRCTYPDVRVILVVHDLFSQHASDDSPQGCFFAWWERFFHQICTNLSSVWKQTGSWFTCKFSLQKKQENFKQKVIHHVKTASGADVSEWLCFTIWTCCLFGRRRSSLLTRWSAMFSCGQREKGCGWNWWGDFPRKTSTNSYIVIRIVETSLWIIRENER